MFETEIEKPRTSVGCPFHTPRAGEPNVYGATDLTYNEYLKVPEMLNLQIPQSKPAHHDELLFIVIHQAYELWFKLILHEIEAAMAFLKENQPLKALHFIKRCVEIMRILVQQIHILETMKPVDFLRFRDKLKPASGFQSVQFREIEFVAGLKDERYLHFFENDPAISARLKSRLTGADLGMVFFDMLRSLGFNSPSGRSSEDRAAQVQALIPIYQNPDEHLSLYTLCEALLEFDEYLGLWRDHHVRVIERIIGFKEGTGGSSGVEYLRTTTPKKCFPALWDVRTHLK